MFDILIRGGILIDGSKSPRRRADLAVLGDKIAALGELPGAEVRQTIDAAGLVVAPGFIDVHNHSDGWLLKTPHLESKTRQGFTTEVLMADGISYAPVNGHTAREWMFYLRSLNALRVDEYGGWQRLDDFMRRIEGRNVQNAATHVPYANVRSLACGFGRQPVDDYQMREIQYHVAQGMEQGAVGLSTGLDYIVQCFSTTDELAQACGPVAEHDGLYVTHVRYKQGLFAALDEAVEIGRRSGARVHISHLKAQSPGEVERLLEYIDRAARQVDFSFDVYPYQPGSTMMNALLPNEVWEDGPLAALGKLREPQIRARFAQGLEAFRLDLDHIHVAWVPSKENAGIQGLKLSEYVEQTGLPAEEALCNLLIEERLAVLLVFDEGDDALVRPILQHDLHMLGSDGIYFPDAAIHPRQYGSAGRMLGPLVRDLKLFSLEEAVWKLSGFPAARFGFPRRGVLQENNFADVVVFDADTITDRATHGDPQQFTEGVHHVLVNGQVIVSGGKAANLEERPPGRFVRKGE